MLVAAIILAFIGIGVVPPRRVILLSWRTRSILTCSESGMSPISSRNNVPPLASSNMPFFRLTAPVKAPFSYPNSSLSSRFSGTPPMFIATNGPSLAADQAWISRATTSLPVPLSPVMRTVALEGAIFLTISLMCIIGALSPTNEPCSSSLALAFSTMLRRLDDSTRLLILMHSSSGSNGLTI